MRRYLALPVILGCLSASVDVVMAQQTSVGVPTETTSGTEVRRAVNLRQCLELAERHFPKVSQARARLHAKRAQAREARYAPFSEFTATGGLVLAPTVRGTALYSPDTDQALSSNMALAWQAGLQGVVPLYTFGKIQNGWDAADAQEKLGEHDLKKEANELRLNVRKAYYGALLARDALALIHEAKHKVDAILERMTKDVAEGNGDDIELLKLKVHRSDLLGKESEVRRQQAAALSGLKFLTGIRGELKLPAEPLRPAQHQLGALDRYLAAARLYRPEINMARAGLAARRALLRLEQSRRFPDVALGMNAKWAYAPEVVDQTNPFVRDDGNYLHYGIGLVVRYKLDFLSRSATIDRARADVEEVSASEQLALGGIAQQVEEAFADVTESKRQLAICRDATQLTKQWLIKVQQGIDVGTMDEQDIVEPAKEYALKRFAELSAIFTYDVALAKLAEVTGWDAIAEDR